MDGRVKNKGGRPPSKPKLIAVIDKVESVELPTITQEEFEHKGHVIHIEPHGRVIVSKLGLYVTEFVDTDTGIEALVEKAKVFINATIR